MKKLLKWQDKRKLPIKKAETFDCGVSLPAGGGGGGGGVDALPANGEAPLS